MEFVVSDMLSADARAIREEVRRTMREKHLRGKGVPSLRDPKSRGDHYVLLTVQVPTRMSVKAKELLKQFDAECGDTLGAADRYRAEHSEDGDGTDPKKKKKKGLFG